MPRPFLDLHTHLTAQHPEVCRIQSLHLSESSFLAMPKTKPISIGLHPWYTKFEELETMLKYLKVLAQQPNVWLIGECGLDKLRGEPLELQLPVLKAQILLAQQFQKPVILHCVRAFEALIQVKKQLQPSVPLIIHGFQKKPALARQLQEQGFYLSFGSALLKSPELMDYVSQFSGVFFLETDDAAHSIQEIYEGLAERKKIDLDEMKDIIFANWQQIGLLKDH